MSSRGGGLADRLDDLEHRQEELASQLDVPPRLLHNILNELIRLGFVVATDPEMDCVGYQPAQSLEKIKLHEVLRGLAVDGTDYSSRCKSQECGIILGVSKTLQDAEQQALAGMTLRDLVLHAEEAEPQQAG